MGRKSGVLGSISGVLDPMTSLIKALCCAGFGISGVNGVCIALSLSALLAGCSSALPLCLEGTCKDLEPVLGTDYQLYFFFKGPK